MAERVGCGTPCLLGNLGCGFAPQAGAIVRRVFHLTRKPVRFSLLKCLSIPNSEIRSHRGVVQVTDHLCLPLIRHPATLKTMPIPANYYICRIAMAMAS